MICTQSFLKALETLYQDNTVVLVSASGGSVEETYRQLKQLLELKIDIALVDDRAATQHAQKLYQANPVMDQVEAGPKQTGKEARRKRREQERNKKLFCKI